MLLDYAGGLLAYLRPLYPQTALRHQQLTTPDFVGALAPVLGIERRRAEELVAQFNDSFRVAALAPNPVVLNALRYLESTQPMSLTFVSSRTGRALEAAKHQLSRLGFHQLEIATTDVADLLFENQVVLSDRVPDLRRDPSGQLLVVWQPWNSKPVSAPWIMYVHADEASDVGFLLVELVRVDGKPYVF